MDENNAELSFSVNLKCSFIYTYLNNYFKPDLGRGAASFSDNQSFSIIDIGSKNEIGSISLKFIPTTLNDAKHPNQQIVQQQSRNVQSSDTHNRNKMNQKGSNQNLNQQQGDVQMNHEYVQLTSSSYGTAYCANNSAANNASTFQSTSTNSMSQTCGQYRANVMASHSDDKNNSNLINQALNNMQLSNQTVQNMSNSDVKAKIESSNSDSARQPKSTNENNSVMYLTSNPNGEFSCSYCAYKSPKRNLVRLHFYNNHRNLFLHCFYCSYANRQRKMLQYHYWNVHRLDMETSKALLRKTKFKETRNSAPVSRRNERNNAQVPILPKPPTSNSAGSSGSNNLPFPLTTFLPNLDQGVPPPPPPDNHQQQNFNPTSSNCFRNNFNA